MQSRAMGGAFAKGFCKREEIDVVHDGGFVGDGVAGGMECELGEWEY